MNKTILSLAAITTMSMAMPADKSGQYYDVVQDIVGSISFQDRAEYKAIGKDIKQNGTKQDMAQFFKKTIVAETSTVNAINYLNKNNDTFAARYSGTDLFHANGKVNKDSEQYANLNAKRLEAYDKHVYSEQPGHLPDVIVAPIPGEVVITDPIVSDPILKNPAPKYSNELSAVALNLTADIYEANNFNFYTGVKVVSVNGSFQGMDVNDDYAQFIIGAEYEYEIASNFYATAGIETQVGEISGVSPSVGVKYKMNDKFSAYIKAEALTVGITELDYKERVVTPTFGLSYKF